MTEDLNFHIHGMGEGDYGGVIVAFISSEEAEIKIHPNIARVKRISQGLPEFG
jgi:hypothetical protein